MYEWPYLLHRKLYEDSFFRWRSCAYEHVQVSKRWSNISQNRFTICKLPRQSGKSTIIIAILALCFVQSKCKCCLLANKSSTARDILGRLQLGYEHLPKWLQQGVISWNKGSLDLENGSSILAASTSACAIRGGSYNIIFLDEFAYVPSTVQDEFFSSVYPTISSGRTSRVLITSTPNGMNMFYKLWHDAENKKWLCSNRSTLVRSRSWWSMERGNNTKHFTITI